jgi:hypothetical protein
MLLTSEQRQKMNRALKHGPKFGDREKLAAYTARLYQQITGRSLWQVLRHGT